MNIEEAYEATIGKALKIYPRNDEVYKHNQRIMNHFKHKSITFYKIEAQNELIDNK